MITSTTTAPTVAETDRATALCSTCAHAVASHDTIGLRFCAATLANALPRGCICRLP